MQACLLYRSSCSFGFVLVEGVIDALVRVLCSLRQNNYSIAAITSLAYQQSRPNVDLVSPNTLSDMQRAQW